MRNGSQQMEPTTVVVTRANLEENTGPQGIEGEEGILGLNGSCGVEGGAR